MATAEIDVQDAAMREKGTTSSPSRTSDMPKSNDLRRARRRVEEKKSREEVREREGEEVREEIGCLLSNLVSGAQWSLFMT